MAIDNTSAGNVVKADQLGGTSDSKTQNPQDTAPPVLTGAPGSFGPSRKTFTDLGLPSLDDPISPDLKTIANQALLASGAATTTTIPNPLTNDLMRYATYTYAFSFEVAKPDAVNAMYENRSYDINAWIPLVKTGGLGKNRKTGKYFAKDFYIDNVRIQSIIGMSPLTRITNSITVDFTITEPYGVSFLEQLYDFATEELKQQNYLDMCYMLKIDFIGYDDTGKSELLTRHRKYIPIRLVSADLSITAAGAVYEIKAIPFNHMAATEIYGRVPPNLSGEGATIGELLSTGTKSLEKALSDHYRTLKEKEITELNDDYKIEILSDDIANALLTPPNAVEQKDLQMLGAELMKDSRIKGKMQGFASGQFLATPVEPKKTNPKEQDTKPNIQQFAFTAGSSIVDTIENIIKGSTYITDQIVEFQKKLIDLYYDKDESSGKYTNRKKQEPTDKQIEDAIGDIPVKWFRITPTVVFKEDGSNIFDKKKNLYAKVITYKISPYMVYSNKSVVAGNANPEKYDRVIKNYDYIYTGKNSEILNFDIKFDMSFYTLITFNSATQPISTGAQDAQPTPPLNKKLSANDSIKSGSTLVHSANNDQAAVGIGQETTEKSRAGDLASSLYNPSDLIQMELEIIGDPDYIIQDDIFFQVKKNDTTTGIRQEQTASTPTVIFFNSGEIYYKFSFFVPQDYNLETGLMNIDTNLASQNVRRNMYSGLYKIITVESIFENGLFKQKLDAYRLQNTYQ